MSDHDKNGALIELAATWCEAQGRAKLDPMAPIWERRAKMLREGYKPQLASAPSATGPITVYVQTVESVDGAVREFREQVEGASSFSKVLPMVVENGLCIAMTGTGQKGLENAHRIANALNASAASETGAIVLPSCEDIIPVLEKENRINGEILSEALEILDGYRKTLTTGSEELRRIDKLFESVTEEQAPPDAHGTHSSAREAQENLVTAGKDRPDNSAPCVAVAPKAWLVTYESLACTSKIGCAKETETWASHSFVTDDKDKAENAHADFDDMGGMIGKPWRNKVITPLYPALCERRDDK